ncbi:MAG: hypothetical protein E7035_00895 [Verrucomicrobiaceae bacterium]|nr:hypothetical protein [Verrucomicrobiaceae bacterium]
MILKRFLSRNRIIDIKSDSLEGAVQELLATIQKSILPEASRKSALQSIIEREKNMSTYLGSGVCMPHTRIKGLKQKYIFAIGRCPNGLSFDNSSNDTYSKTRTLFLLISDEKVDSYLNVLSTLSRTLSEEKTAEKLNSNITLKAYADIILQAFTPQSKKKTDEKKSLPKKASIESKILPLIARSASKIARGSGCNAILLQGDVFEEIPDLSKYFGKQKIVVMTERPVLPIPDSWNIINVRTFTNERFSQLKSAIIIGLTRGIFSISDKICCVGGMKDSNMVDSIIILDIAKHFSDIFSQKNLLPNNIKPEVLERIIDIATELSIEGREGKPVGCIFIVGNENELKPHLKQLILNPFSGYKPEDRNILNPFMDETLKEYSLIDGAFIIDENGIMLSAGTLIHTPDFRLQLPGGLGARHAAAYAISLMTDCIAVVVSSSTGYITMFRKGQTIPLTDKKK